MSRRIVANENSGWQALGLLGDTVFFFLFIPLTVNQHFSANILSQHNFTPDLKMCSLHWLLLLL